MFLLENGDATDVKLFPLNQRYGSSIESDDVFVEFDHKGIKNLNFLTFYYLQSQVYKSLTY